MWLLKTGGPLIENDHMSRFDSTYVLTIFFQKLDFFQLFDMCIGTCIFGWNPNLT